MLGDTLEQVFSPTAAGLAWQQYEESISSGSFFSFSAFQRGCLEPKDVQCLTGTKEGVPVIVQWMAGTKPGFDPIRNAFTISRKTLEGVISGLGDKPTVGQLASALGETWQDLLGLLNDQQTWSKPAKGHAKRVPDSKVRELVEQWDGLDSVVDGINVHDIDSWKKRLPRSPETKGWFLPPPVLEAFEFSNRSPGRPAPQFDEFSREQGWKASIIALWVDRKFSFVHEVDEWRNGKQCRVPLFEGPEPITYAQVQKALDIAYRWFQLPEEQSRVFSVAVTVGDDIKRIERPNGMVVEEELTGRHKKQHRLTEQLSEEFLSENRSDAEVFADYLSRQHRVGSYYKTIEVLSPLAEHVPLQGLDERDRTAIDGHPLGWLIRSGISAVQRPRTLSLKTGEVLLDPSTFKVGIRHKREQTQSRSQSFLVQTTVWSKKDKRFISPEKDAEVLGTRSATLFGGALKVTLSPFGEFWLTALKGHLSFHKLDPKLPQGEPIRYYPGDRLTYQYKYKLYGLKLQMADTWEPGDRIEFPTKIAEVLWRFAIRSVPVLQLPWSELRSRADFAERRDSILRAHQQGRPFEHLLGHRSLFKMYRYGVKGPAGDCFKPWKRGDKVLLPPLKRLLSGIEKDQRIPVVWRPAKEVYPWLWRFLKKLESAYLEGKADCNDEFAELMAKVVRELHDYQQSTLQTLSAFTLRYPKGPLAEYLQSVQPGYLASKVQSVEQPSGKFRDVIVDHSKQESPNQRITSLLYDGIRGVAGQLRRERNRSYHTSELFVLPDFGHRFSWRSLWTLLGYSAQTPKGWKHLLRMLSEQLMTFTPQKALSFLTPLEFMNYPSKPGVLLERRFWWHVQAVGFSLPSWKRDGNVFSASSQELLKAYPREIWGDLASRLFRLRRDVASLPNIIPNSADIKAKAFLQEKRRLVKLLSRQLAAATGSKASRLARQLSKEKRSLREALVFSRKDTFRLRALAHRVSPFSSLRVLTVAGRSHSSDSLLQGESLHRHRAPLRELLADLVQEDNSLALRQQDLSSLLGALWRECPDTGLRVVQPDDSVKASRLFSDLHQINRLRSRLSRRIANFRRNLQNDEVYSRLTETEHSRYKSFLFSALRKNQALAAFKQSLFLSYDPEGMRQARLSLTSYKRISDAFPLSTEGVHDCRLLTDWLNIFR